MATYNTVGSGDWSDTSIWDDGGGAPSGPPGVNDRVIINNTHTVTIDNSYTIGDSPADQTTDVISIQAGGELKWEDSPGGSWTLEVRGNIGIARLGRFEIGRYAGGMGIPAAETATLYFPTDLGPASGWIIDNQGEFEVCGSRYHMAADAYQRTKLAADVTANPGNQVAFTTDDPVDWNTGDTVWFGTGGDPTQVATGNEKVVITKTDASNYTADFANDHHDGDFIIHTTRNVILDSDDNTKGMQIINTLEGNDGQYADDLVINMRWCSLHFFGKSTSNDYAAIKFNTSSGVGDDWDYHFPANAIILKNLIIDKGAYTNATLTTFAIYINSDLDFQDTSEFIDEVHTWLQQMEFSMNGWEMHVGHLTFLEAYQGVFSYGYGSIQYDGFWYSCRGITTGYALTGRPRKLENFEMHRYAQGIQLVSGAWQSRLEGQEFSNGKFYHATGQGPAVYFNEASKTRTYFDDVEFYGSTGAGSYPFYILWCSIAGPAFFRNCSFDGCRSANYGAVRLDSFNATDCYFYNCTFGTKAPNRYINVGLSTTSDIGVCRVRFEDCTIKKPPDVDPQQPFFTNVFTWAISVGATNPGSVYTDRINWGRTATIEFVNCQILDDSDVDQWPNRYPGVTRYAYVSGGGEIRDESTEILDGSFASKLLPFSPAGPCWVNETFPIKIPVNSGETVTAKLSFKRNANGDHDLPGLKLNGCGIFDETYLTGSEAFGDWHELTVTGTAVYAGTVNLLVSAGTNNRGQALARQNKYTFYKPVQPVPPDWDDMFSVVVYADGLDIAVE